MFTTVAEYKDSLTGMLTGTNLNDVTNLNGALERAARITLQQAKIPEAVDRTSFMLYDGVTDYPGDLDMFGTSIIDMRPQGVARVPTDYTYKDTMQNFDRNKGFTTNGHTVAFEYDRGEPIMRVTSPYSSPRIIIDPMNATTGWVAGGSATNLTTDSTVFYQAPAALRFNLAAAGSQGYIEKTLTNGFDLTAYKGVGVGFLAVDLPSATDITSVGFHLGSDNANYFDVSNTQGFLGAWVAGTYLLVALDLALATQVGSPALTQMDYVRVYVNYDGGAQTNVRLGGLWISLPSPTEVIYQTAGIFKNSVTGLLSRRISSDNDYIILNDAAYTLYEHEGALAVLGQNGGSTGSGLAASISQKLYGARTRTGSVIQLGLYDLYREENPAQELKTVDNWYTDGPLYLDN